MIHVMKFNLRHYWSDWRFIVTVIILFGCYMWDMQEVMVANNFSKFVKRYGFDESVPPQEIAHILKLDEPSPETFESIYDVWCEYRKGTYESSLYYYIGTLCNPSMSSMLLYSILSIWIVSSSIQNRSVSKMIVCGYMKWNVFWTLVLMYFTLVLGIRFSAVLISLKTLPIGYSFFPNEYVKGTMNCWTIFCLCEASFYFLTAVAFSPLLATIVDVLWAFIPFFVPETLRWTIIPSCTLAHKAWWKPETFMILSHQPAVIAMFFLILLLALSCLVFQKRELK